MDNVLAQVRAVDRGDTNVITCPYCGKQNRENISFCCELLAQASVAALERIRFEQAKEVAERAMERHQRN